MKKLIKKLLILTVIAAMVVTAMPLTGVDLTSVFTLKVSAAVEKKDNHASSVDYAYFTVGEKDDGGYCEIIKYLGSETNIVVPEFINGWTVKRIGNGAFVDDTENLNQTNDYWINPNLENITSVTLPETVTEIYASFQYLKKLNSINIPKNVKGLYDSFRGCESLEKIELPEGLSYIHPRTFEDTAITELVLPDGIRVLTKDIFCNTKIKKLTLSKNITEFESYTLYCESLETLIVKGFVETVSSDAFSESSSGKTSYPEKIVFLQAPCDDVLAFTDKYNFTYNFEENYWELTKKMPLTDVRDYDYNFSYIINENNEAIITWMAADYRNVIVPESVSDEEYVPVVEIAPGACTSRTRVQNVILPSTVKKLGEQAFFGCTQLQTINLSEVEYVGAQAFAECAQLQSIDTSSMIYIGASAFSGCKALNNVTLPELVHVEPALFKGCEALETIHIPESVKEICAEAFFECTTLKTVTGCKNIEKIGGYAFKGTLLESIPFGKKLKEIDKYAFFGTKITDVTLSDGVEKIGDYAFKGANNFSKLILPETVKEIGLSSFNSCKIEELYLPDGLQKLGKYAFSNTLISSLDIPSGLTEIPDYAFSNCNNLAVIDIPSNIKRIGADAFSCEETLLSQGSVNIADGVEEICARAFSGKVSNELTIPESVKILYLSTLKGMQIQTLNYNAPNAAVKTSEGGLSLLYQTNVKTVNFSNKVKSIPYRFGAESTVETINFTNSIEYIEDYAFSDCKKLKEINLPQNLKTIGDFSFYNCDLLTEVVFPDSVISLGERAFGGCDSLTQITLPKNVESVGKWAFYACDSATEITIPENVHSFSQDAFWLCGAVTTVNMNAVSCTVVPESTSEVLPKSPFIYLKNLKNINIGNTVKELPSYIFSSLDKIDVITLPDSVTDIGAGAFANSTITALKNCKNLESIEEYAFMNCISLTDFDFSNNVKLIGMKAFSGCTGLKDIYIPDSVVNIEIGVFSDCSALESVRMSSNVDYIPLEAFNNCTELSKFIWDAESKLVGRLAFGNCIKLIDFDFINVEKLYVNSFLGSGVNVVQLGETENEASPTPLTTIEVQSFKDCENLATLGIGGNVTTVKSQAFADCTNLETAVIADSVTEIADDAFDGCDKLTIYCTENSYAHSYAQTQGIKVSTFVIAPIPNQTYTGFEIKPEITVSASGDTLDKNIDFSVSYANNINVGNADVTVKGMGDFRMFASKAMFTIVTKNISAVSVSPIADQPYTGSAVTPEITVTDGIKVLREGTDYTVTYENNVNEGSANVTITGKGNYSGTATTNFQISKEAEEPVEPSFFEKVFSAVISFFARIIAFLVSIFM